MNIVVLIYMIVCIVLLVFDIIFLVVKNIRNHRFYPRMSKFERQVKEEIARKEKEGSFSLNFQKKLVNKLSKTKYMIALQNVLEEHPEAREDFKKYIFACLDAYKKKNYSEQAYYAYIVSVLGYEEEGIPQNFVSEFVEFLDSKSLNIFFNAINAVYEFGDVNILMAAIDKIDERVGFYHEKLFVDGMLRSRVDKKEFIEKLKAHFDKYTDLTKCCILDYFRFSGAEVSDFCMECVKNSNLASEIRYAAMRYFVKYPCEEAKKYFTNILEREDGVWVEEMLSIQGLSTYNDSQVRVLIKKKITSPDWYVRLNAAEYLKKNNLAKEELAEIVAYKDKYTNEMLLYQYQEDAEMHAYISQLIEKERIA